MPTGCFLKGFLPMFHVGPFRAAESGDWPRKNCDIQETPFFVPEWSLSYFNVGRQMIYTLLLNRYSII